MIGFFSVVNFVGGFSGVVFGGMVYDVFGGGGLFFGVGLINLCLGVFFIVFKFRSDCVNVVVYVLFESESIEEVNVF